MEDLGTLPGHTHCEAVGINNHGEIVGHCRGPRGARGVRWPRSGGLQDLGVLAGGTYSRALAINDRGEIVGSSDGAVGVRAFLWTTSDGLQDLNARIPSPKNFILTEAVNINGHGMILATGQDDHGPGHHHGDHESPMRIFLLVPGP
jgi:probable HAF family extracellular repeat protein